MSKILVTAFKDPGNSSEILLNKINCNVDKLYISLGYEISRKEFMNVIENNEYDYIISFGQKPVTKKLYIEEYANGQKKDEIYKSKYDYSSLVNTLNNYNVSYKISTNAGNHYCNYIYYLGLKHIENNNLNTKMIFIHIPYLNNIGDVSKLSNIISKYIDAIK